MKEDPEGYFYEKRQQELDSKPKTIGNYLKNWWASHGRQMNDFQIEDFQGYIDRSNKWRELAADLQEQWDIEDRVNEINKEISVLNNSVSNSSQQSINVQQRIDALLREQQQLVNRHDQLNESVEAFKSYIPGKLSTGLYNMLSGNGETNLLTNNAIFGRTSQFHNEMGDFLRHTSTMFNPNRSRTEQRQMLQRAIDEYDNKVNEWQRAIDLNIQDRESYYRPDRWFQERADKAGTDIFSKDTWLYKMPGLIAGSTSGASKILPAMLTGLGTGIAFASTGGLAGFGLLAAGSAAAYGMNYAAGISENNSEVANAYNERLEDYLRNEKGENDNLYNDIVKEGRKKLAKFDGIKKMSDGQIFELYRAGYYDINNVHANKKMRELATGIENQHQDNMAATSWQAGVETALEVIPFGKVISLPRTLKYQLLKTAARREAVRNGGVAAKTLQALEKYDDVVKTLGEGYRIGSSVGPVGGAVYAPMHLAVSPVLKRVGKEGKDILNAIATSARISEDIPADLLGKHLISDTRKRYFKDLAGRWALASFSEGVEEGKQSISAERYKNGEYTSDKIKSIGETILDDFLAGSKSAGLILGMPFEGLMSESDRKTLQEIKGGLLVGGLQTAIVNVAQDIAPYTGEQSANTAIVNSVLLQKAEKIDKLNKARIYAEASKSSSAYQNILQAFDRLGKLNRDNFDSTGEYAIPQEHIEEERKNFKRVAQMANDRYTIKQAKAQGIQPGSGLYNDFVAAKVLAEDEVNDNVGVYNISVENLNAARQSLREELLTQVLRDSAIELPQEEQSENQAAPKRINLAGQGVEQAYKQIDTVANWVALLRTKQHLEAGILNAEQGGHSKTKQILSHQLTKVNDKLNNLRKLVESYTNENEAIDINNIESVEKYLVLDKENHDNISEAYRQNIMTGFDMDLATEQYEKVVGEAVLNGEKVSPTSDTKWDEEFGNVTFKNGNAKSVIREIRETV